MALPFLMEVEMKIEDMIMVIENRKGVETNMLCTLTEFVVNFVARGNKDQITILDEVLKLQETKQDAPPKGCLLIMLEFSLVSIIFMIIGFLKAEN